jgi:hypothetical protein
MARDIVVEKEFMPLWKFLLKGMLASTSRDPFNRPGWDGAIFLMTPDISCLATIMLSLWDKMHSPRRAFD